MIKRYQLEFLVLIFLTVLFICIGLFFITNEYWVNALTLFMLVGMLFFTWLFSNKGMHPAFLFQLFLLLFQGGKFIGYFVGDFHHSIWILDMISKPIKFSEKTIQITCISLSSSVFCIFAISLIKLREIRIMTPVIRSKTFFYIYISTLPFYIFKNVFYLSYIMSHGGYIAIYTNNGEHINSVGLPVRILSSLCFIAYIMYIMHEKNVVKLKYNIIVFMIVSVLELLIGLRGKYFVFLILNIFLYKKRKNSGFNPLKSIIPALIIIIIASSIGSIRENRDVETENIVSSFLNNQGVSLEVSAMAVEMYKKFHPYSLNYFINQFNSDYSIQNKFKPGGLLQNDFTYELNPAAFNNGFGLGTTYFAELYLLYGVITVIIGSLILGIGLSIGNNYFFGFLGSLNMIFLMSLIYLPRYGFMDPIVSLIKYSIPILIVYNLALVIDLLKNKKIVWSIQSNH